MKKDIKFIIIFLFVSSFSYLIVWKFYTESIPIVGTDNVALVLYKILQIAGLNTIIDNDKIYLPNNNSLTIILECTGIYEMIILNSIIISYPTNLINKFFGIISGVSVIYVLNMIRLVSIVYVLEYYADKFDFIERYIWQISLVILISIAYMIWLKMIGPDSSLSSS